MNVRINQARACGHAFCIDYEITVFKFGFIELSNLCQKAIFHQDAIAGTIGARHQPEAMVPIFTIAISSTLPSMLIWRMSAGSSVNP